VLGRVRLLGRILAGLVGLPLFLLGSFGLISHHFPGTGFLQVVYSALQGTNEFLINQGMDVPIDASVTLEEWLVHPALRYVVAPIGVILLALAAGVRIARKEPESAEPEASADDPTAVTDKRAKKKLMKEAAALRKKGQFEEAGDLLWSAKELDKAADYFVEGEIFGRAAEIRHDQNRFVESAELHLQAGNHESAGAIFAQQEEWARAAESYYETGSMSVAAEMYDKAGDYANAAKCYEQVEFHRHAASAYVKVKNWSKAADCLEEVFRSEFNTVKNDAAKLAELQKVAKQAGKLFHRAGKTEKAKHILEEAECWLEAGQVAVHLENFAEAAEFFRNACDLPRAADALRQLGENEAAARILGEYHRDRGELKEAAEQLEASGDFSEAGDLHRQLESYGQAGSCYRQGGDHAAAAEMYSMDGDRAAAAECYERAGRYTEAAECCALAGAFDREAELLDKAGEHMKAGEVFHREGLDDEAITALQKIDPEHEDFGRASALLGDMFRSRGQFSLAINKLRQSIGERQLERDNLPVYYTLATILEANDQLAEAVEIYEKVMAFDYHYEDVERRLVEAKGRLPEGVPMTQAPTGGGTGTGTIPVAQSGQPGRYQVVGELGRGGMGIVYKAKDTLLDRVVAYKVLPDTFKENPQAVANFMREAKAAAKLNHPNIVTVYDTGEQDGRYYIAMEFVDGTTLKEILRRRGVVSPAGILHVLVQMCEALAYAHEKKVVHRDIKPANAMWTRDKKAKIMDFGLAKVLEEVRNHTTVVAGTPYYMSPEQTLGKNVDHRTDIYSLGVSCFELATGTVPFKEGNIPYHHVHTPAPDIREIRPEIPAALAAIVNRCLAKDPADRYQSTSEILEDVRESLGNSQTRTQQQ
jgi:tetratricopeptide (TPR) repeat protein